MSKEKKSKASEPIHFETVYPIHIRSKDGALAFAPPGETVAFEENPEVKIAMLAHKLNEIIIQTHRLQRAVFTNNKMLAEFLEGKNGTSETTKK